MRIPEKVDIERMIANFFFRFVFDSGTDSNKNDVTISQYLLVCSEMHIFVLFVRIITSQFSSSLVNLNPYSYGSFGI